MARIVSALRITRTSTRSHPVHLPLFAMWPAFPTADYYGGSVALGLSPRRQSRVPCARDGRMVVGALFVPLGSLDFDPACPGRVTVGTRAIPRFGRASDVNRRIRPVLFTVRALGFSRCRLHHAIRASVGPHLDGFGASCLSEHAVVPSGFRLQVGSVAHGYYVRPIPHVAVILSRRDTAHLMPIVRVGPAVTPPPSSHGPARPRDAPSPP